MAGQSATPTQASTQMSTPIFDELLREMSAAAAAEEPQAATEQPTPTPAPQPAQPSGGRRRRAD